VDAAVEAYTNGIKTILKERGNPTRAQGQMGYMRYQFEYFGLKAPEWVAISKEYFKNNGILQGDELWQFARLCYVQDQREMQYIALQAIEMTLKKPQDPKFIELLEELITIKSWWDTVDWISKLVGKHFMHHPKQIVPITEKWMDSNHIWLQRVAVIFQLAYKDKTDTALLFKYILRLATSKEFFIQKAAGWALRQHTRTDANIVEAFVAQNPQLAPLTKREALRLLKHY
jgi:3-methyladenine DNA glycosylase AlkD